MFRFPLSGDWTVPADREEDVPTMPNYEHFKKYDEWSKQKPQSQPSPAPGKPESGLSKLLRSLKGSGKKG